MRVLVTGVSGFIGASVAPLLAARGHGVRSVRGDSASLDEAFAGCEAVIHLANIAHTKAGRALLWRVNVDGTRRVAEFAVKHGLRRMVYLSSIKASGEETADRRFDGSEPGAPEDDYGRAKLAAERTLFEIAARSELEVVVLRPPLVYGAGVKANFLQLMSAIARGLPLPFAGIDNRRDLVHVGNLCDAIARCVESASVGGRTYVVCDGRAVSTPSLCHAIGRALGRPAKLFSVPAWLLPRKLVASLEVDDSSIRRELGWQPPFSFEEGLRLTADWYRTR